MKLLKLKDVSGTQIIVNLDNVAYYYSISATVTNICFMSTEQYISVAITINEFESMLTDDYCFIYNPNA